MDVNVPMAHRRTCSLCAAQVDSRSTRLYTFGSGWFKLGTKTAHLLKTFDRYACEDCIYRIEHGIGIGQVSIFDELA